MDYDAQTAPNTEDWNALDEGDRLSAIIEYHEKNGDDHPNLRLHAAIHAVVENQISMGEAAPVDTLNRLVSEGLDRHEQRCTPSVRFSQNRYSTYSKGGNQAAMMRTVQPRTRQTHREKIVENGPIAPVLSSCFAMIAPDA